MLFVDTFSNYFEPENVHAAQEVLEAAGYGVEIASPADKAAAVVLRPDLSCRGPGGRSDASRRGACSMR